MSAPFVSLAPRPEARPVLDVLVRRRAAQDVWHRLAHHFPLLSQVRLSVAHARREGDVRRAIEALPEGDPLRDPFGPATQTDWERLGVLAYRCATGVEVEAAQLYSVPSPLVFRHGSWACRERAGSLRRMRCLCRVCPDCPGE